ncbi:MAG: sodium:calcium antiporter [Candidatus Micrarchaeota archaeon]
MLEWLYPLAFVLGGMVLIFKAAEKSTENALTISRMLGISELAIGFVLLSISTSLPELVISVSAALRGSSDLSVGNVFGANITDVTLVLGVAAILGVVTVKRQNLKELVMVLLATSVISLLFVIYQPGRVTGAILFGIFLAYTYWLLSSKSRSGKSHLRLRFTRKMAAPLFGFSIFITLVIISAQLVVENAIKLSGMLGLAETVIGATIISVGTTLPELSVSISAARRNHEKMAVGNAVGSSIMNLTLVFGTALMINPQITFEPAEKLIVISVIANMVLLYLITIRGGLTKKDGVGLALGYLAFLAIFGLGNL